MKKYLWAALSLLVFFLGFVVIFSLLTKGYAERPLGNTGVPFIMDAGASIVMIGMGSLGLKAFWDDISNKNDIDKDNT